MAAHDKPKYSRSHFVGLIVQGDVHGAVAYLDQFPTRRRYARNIRARFESPGELPAQGEWAPLLVPYHRYYADILWHGTDPHEAEARLTAGLADVTGSASTSLDEQECALKEIVESRGASFLGGDTQGIYGPYLWTSDTCEEHTINLPDGSIDLTLHMLEGFIERSWIDFATLAKAGTGGWAGHDGTEIFCVKKSFAGVIGTPKFDITFLMHEAQHALDFRTFGDIPAVDLEYRAKLVELINWPTISRFHSLAPEGNLDDPSNSHTMAMGLIVKHLSERILLQPYVTDRRQWRGRNAQIREVARALLSEHRRDLESQNADASAS